jgi:hypothetical protein
MQRGLMGMKGGFRGFSGFATRCAGKNRISYWYMECKQTHQTLQTHPWLTGATLSRRPGRPG